MILFNDRFNHIIYLFYVRFFRHILSYIPDFQINEIQYHSKDMQLWFFIESLKLNMYGSHWKLS